MAKVSIIIPSRDCQYAAKTVEDIYENATGDIEVIVLLDSYWPDPPIKERPNLMIVHKGIVRGMRNSINLGVSIAKGRYILKTDDHCMFSKGFDEILQQDMEDDWLVNATRHTMYAETWKKGLRTTEYNYISYPFGSDNKHGNGLYCKKWIGEDGFGRNSGWREYHWKEWYLKDKKIDDMMIFLGSFWFMTRDHFFRIGGLDEKHSDLMEGEPLELTMKTWMSGGRCVVNKNAFYCHMQKHTKRTTDDSRTYAWNLSFEAMRETGRFQTWYWMTDRWPKRTKSIRDFVDRFWPIPGWPPNWEEEGVRYYTEHPEFTSNFRTFDLDGVNGLPLS